MADIVDPAVERIIRGAPKVELHIHLEGALEPEMLMHFAERNDVAVPWADAEDVRAAYDFADLESFLEVYYHGARVLVEREDFYELTMAYLEGCAADGVVHVEPCFDPQTHTSRGIALETVVSGIADALADGDRHYGITSKLIMAFLRDRPEAEALELLEEATPFLGVIQGIGLDSAERGNPPAKFERLFARARELGLHATAHAGEEGPAEYVRDSLDVLHVERIDHGIASIEDPELTMRLARDRVPLTVCPLSSVRLHVVDELGSHPLKRMLDAGLAVCVNSDDPAYFGGYLTDNLRAAAASLDLTAFELATLLDNAVRGSWLSSQAQAELLIQLDKVYASAASEAAQD